MIKIDLLIPTFHRTDMVLEALEHLDQFCFADLGIRMNVVYYVQDASPEDQIRLREANTGVGYSVEFIFAPKHDTPVIGAIRGAAFDAYKSSFRQPDIFWTMDDDVVMAPEFEELFQEGVCKFFSSEYDMAFLREFKNRKLAIVDCFNPSVAVPTAPGIGYGIMVKWYGAGFLVDSLYDATFRKLAVGEDCYYLIKALTCRAKVGSLTGMINCFHEDPNWLNNTKMSGGGISEMATDYLGMDVPADMCKRNKLIGAKDKATFQYYMADCMHYEAAGNGYRRLRPDLLEYIEANFAPCTNDGIARKNGYQLMVEDGTCRTVYGIDQVDYSYLPDLETELNRRFGYE